MSVSQLEAPSPGHSTALKDFFKGVLRIPPNCLPVIFNIDTRKWAGKGEKDT